MPIRIDPLPSVAPRDLGNAEVPRDPLGALGATGRQLGATLDYGAGVLAELNQREKEKARGIRSLHATSTLHEKASALTDSLYDTHGLAAMARQEQNDTELSAEIDKIAADIPEEDRQEWIERVASPQRIESGIQWHRYVRDENEKHATSVWNAYTMGATNQVLAAGDDPAQVVRVMARTVDEMREKGKDQFGSEEELTARIAKWKSGTLHSVVSNLIRSDRASAARGFVKDFGDAMLPEDRADIEATLKPATDRDEALRGSSSRFQGVEWNYTASKRAEIYNDVNAIENADQRGFALSDTDRRFHQLDELKQQVQTEAYTALHDGLDRDPDIGKAKIDRQRWGALTPGMQEALEQRAKQLNDKGPPSETDYAKVMEIWESKTDAGKSKFNLLELLPYVKPETFNQLRGEQNRIQDAENDQNAGVIPSVGGIESRLSEIYGQKDWDKLDKTKRGFLLLESKRRAELEMKNLGQKALSGEQEEKIVGGVIREVHLRPGTARSVLTFGQSSGTETRAGLFPYMTDSEKGKIFVPYDEIPADDAAAVEAIVREERGLPGDVPVPKKLIENAYGQLSRPDAVPRAMLPGIDASLKALGEPLTDERRRWAYGQIQAASGEYRRLRALGKTDAEAREVLGVVAPPDLRQGRQDADSDTGK